MSRRRATRAVEEARAVEDSGPSGASCVSAWCTATDKSGKPKREPRPAEVGRICGPCLTHTRKSLLWLADHWTELQGASLSPRAGSKAARGGRDEDRLPINLPATLASRDAGQWVYAWSRIVLDEQGAIRPRDTSTPGLLRWLALTHLEWFAAHESPDVAVDMIDGAADLHRRAKSALSPAQRVMRLGVRCTEWATAEDGSRVECDGMLTATLPDEDRYTRPDLVCDRDPSHRIDPSVWMRPRWRIRHADAG